jgi:hypothetical protein
MVRARSRTAPMPVVAAETSVGVGLASGAEMLSTLSPETRIPRT